MIFFGAKSSTIKQGQISNVTCPNCKNITTITYTIFGKYAHAYWIPMFPMKKKTVIECNSCYRTYDMEEAPEPIKHKFLRETKGVKNPIWYFSGLALLALLIYVAFYLSKKDEINDALYIEQPQSGDIYTIEAPKAGFYTTIKVTKTTSDSLFVVYNDYDIHRRSKIYRIEKEENYSTNIDSLSKVDLQRMFDEGAIFEVDRD